MKEILNSILGAIESIAAVGNIILLIYFTNREWNYSRERDNQEKNQKIVERKQLWYKKLVIEKVVSYVTEYFENTNKECLKLKPQKEEEKRERVEIIKNYTNQYKHLIVPYLRIFSKTLAREVFRIMQDYNDLLINEMAGNGRSYSFQLDRTEDELKENIILKIYTYDFETNMEPVKKSL